MRKIKIVEWEEIGSDGKPEKITTLTVLKQFLMMAKPEQLPRGFDKFRSYRKIDQAFEKAEKDPNKMIELEDAEYEFLKKIGNDVMPAAWALNKSVAPVIEEFMDAKQE